MKYRERRDGDSTKRLPPKLSRHKPRYRASTASVTMKDCDPADRVFIELMEDIRLATDAERAAWARLEKYLVDGVAPVRRRVRIRIDD